MKKVFSIVLAISLVLGLTISSVGAVAPAPNWDVSGTWDVDLSGHVRQFRDLVQDELGNVEGEFWYKPSDTWLYGGTLVGSVSGNDLYLFYERPAPLTYTGEFVGTISKTGMSGEFTDNNSLQGGEFLEWTTEGSPELLYEARITGGGQLLNGSDVFKKNGKEIDYKVSFGLGVFLVNGQYWLDGASVTLHNVSAPDAVGGKFEAESIISMNFNYPEGIANCQVSGTFNGEPGYTMWIRAQDGGEPSYDNVRFTIEKGSTLIYDTYPNDFPGESSTSGTARHYIEKGNLQVEDFR